MSAATGENGVRDYSPEAVDGAARMLAALSDVPREHRLDALVLDAKKGQR